MQQKLDHKLKNLQEEKVVSSWGSYLYGAIPRIFATLMNGDSELPIRIALSSRDGDTLV